MKFSACRRRTLRAPLLVALAFTTACSFHRSEAPAGNNASPTGSSSSHGTPFTPSNDGLKDFRETIERLNKAFPYRLTEISSSTGPGPGPETSGGTRVAEFVAADRFHVKWANGPLGNTEIITIGDQQYSKFDNGNWTEGAPSEFASLKREKQMREMMASSVKDAHYIGTETIHGVPCHTYAYTMEVGVSGQKWTSTGKAWIGSGDGLPHQFDFELTVNSYKQKSHVTYEYNVDIKVEKPVM